MAAIETSSERHDKGSEGVVLDFLFVGSFLDVLVFSVAGGEGLSVRWGMGIEYPHVKEGTLKTPSPEPTCTNV